MPSVSDFKKANAEKAKAQAVTTEPVHSSSPETSPKRRPGREKTMSANESASKVKVVDVDASEQTEAPTASHETKSEPSHTEIKKEDGIEINFPGSEILRAKFPQSFKVVEKVATDWVKDGDFADLPIPAPAQAAVQQGLKTAKGLEQKIMNSPVTEKVTMQAFTSIMKAQNFFKEIKEKAQRK